MAKTPVEETPKRKRRIIIKETVRRPKTSHKSEKHWAESKLRPPHVIDREGPSNTHDALPRDPTPTAKQWETVKTPRDPLVNRVMRHRETGELVAVTVHPLEHTESFYVSLGQAFGDPWERITRQQRALVLAALEDYSDRVDSATAEVALEHHTMRLRVPCSDPSLCQTGEPRGKDFRKSSLTSSLIPEGEAQPTAVPPIALEEIERDPAAGVSSMDVELEGKPNHSVHPMPGAVPGAGSSGHDVVADRPGAAHGAGADYVRAAVTRKRALPVFQSSGVTDAEIRKTGLTPGLVCDNCAIGIECPEYNAGYVCAYNPAFRAFPARSQELVLGAMRHIADKNKERAMRAYHYEEVVNGGQIDPNVTRLSETVMSQLSTLIELERESIRAELEIGGEGGSEKKPGLLSRLFGGGETAPQSPKSLVESTTTLIPTEVRAQGRTREAVIPIKAQGPSQKVEAGGKERPQ